MIEEKKQEEKLLPIEAAIMVIFTEDGDIQLNLEPKFSKNPPKRIASDNDIERLYTFLFQSFIRQEVVKGFMMAMAMAQRESMEQARRAATGVVGATMTPQIGGDLSRRIIEK